MQREEEKAPLTAPQTVVVKPKNKNILNHEDAGAYFEKRKHNHRIGSEWARRYLALVGEEFRYYSSETANAPQKTFPLKSLLAVRTLETTDTYVLTEIAFEERKILVRSPPRDDSAAAFVKVIKEIASHLNKNSPAHSPHNSLSPREDEKWDSRPTTSKVIIPPTGVQQPSPRAYSSSDDADSPRPSSPAIVEPLAAARVSTLPRLIPSGSLSGSQQMQLQQQQQQPQSQQQQQQDKAGPAKALSPRLDDNWDPRPPTEKHIMTPRHKKQQNSGPHASSPSEKKLSPRTDDNWDSRPHTEKNPVTISASPRSRARVEPVSSQAFFPPQPKLSPRLDDNWHASATVAKAPFSHHASPRENRERLLTNSSDT